MRIEFFVAIAPKKQKPGIRFINSPAFDSYDKAQKWGNKYSEKYSWETYLVVERKYLFRCKGYQDYKYKGIGDYHLEKLYKKEILNGIKVKMSIHSEPFLKNPEKFLNFAQVTIVLEPEYHGQVKFYKVKKQEKIKNKIKIYVDKI